MSFGRRALSALGKVGIVLSIVIIFVVGFFGTVYLSLRTSAVKVPSVLGKDRFVGESTLDEAGLNIRVARTRASVDQKPDTILQQWPAEGEVVKTGQTVAVEISRAPKAGESVPSRTETAAPETNDSNQNTNANQSAAPNQNQTQNQNKPKSKNTNKNSNNSNNKNANNSNNANRNNTNANRDAGNRNADSNRNTNSIKPNTNATPNANRNNQNANKRPPVTPTPSGTGANKSPQ